MIKALMLGAGNKEPKRQLQAKYSKPVDEWVTLDVLSYVKPDVLYDLNSLRHGDQLPFTDEEFDEIHAYEVLEHVGRQGDWRGFFKEFKEYWRILKPSGSMSISAPIQETLWITDVGHVRCLALGILSPLTRKYYELNKESVATDYSQLVDPRWWRLTAFPAENERNFFILSKCK